ncbi:MAG: hypothetical protein F6K41_30865 [Symploca sp. SIO3E6]|nr:hypothetical protein [Caldora sp. SIO3E6]
MSSEQDKKRVVVLQSDGDFGSLPRTLSGSRPKKKRKKQSRVLKPFEKAVRDLAKRQAEATSEYIERHERSNRKKKDGWIKDFPKNYSKSMSKLYGSSSPLGLMGVNYKLF